MAEKPSPERSDERVVLQVEDLRTYFYTRAGVIKAVQGVSFHLDKGETLGIVGESGSGKSVTALSIMRLIPQPPGRYVGGRIVFNGIPIVDVHQEGSKDGTVNRGDRSISEARMRTMRGDDISMIFQDPMTSLNPLLTIGRQIAESVREHMGLSKRASYD